VAIEIRPLRETDDRTAFRSGDPDLDRFFARYAGQNQFRHHIGTTYLALEAGRTLGYATVAPGNLEADALPITVRRALPRYPLPVLRLARLAVDVTAQGQGVGKTLLRHVFLLALQMSQEYGCVGVVVDAKRDAVEFYARVGFSPLEVTEGEIEARPKPAPLFLPIELVAAALVP
jgi:GNAT superfamily N-acetyltransferase